MRHAFNKIRKHIIKRKYDVYMGSPRTGEFGIFYIETRKPKIRSLS